MPSIPVGSYYPSAIPHTLTGNSGASIFARVLIKQTATNCPNVKRTFRL
jgi:hypothetical protein